MIDWPEEEDKKKEIIKEEFIQDPHNPYVKYPKNRVITPKQDDSPTGVTGEAPTWPKHGLSKVLESMNASSVVEAMQKLRGKG